MADEHLWRVEESVPPRHLETGEILPDPRSPIRPFVPRVGRRGQNQSAFLIDFLCARRDARVARDAWSKFWRISAAPRQISAQVLAAALRAGPERRALGRLAARGDALDLSDARLTVPKSTIWHAGAEIRQNFDHVSIATHASRRAQKKSIKEARFTLILARGRTS